MLQFLSKLRLCVQNLFQPIVLIFNLKTYLKSFVSIYDLRHLYLEPSKKVFLQLEHYIKLLFHY